MCDNLITIDIPKQFGFQPIIFAILSTLGVRGILCLTKVWEIKLGGIKQENLRGKEQERFEEIKNKCSCCLLWDAYFCTSGIDLVDDYFLPSIIGFLELIVYPILMIDKLWLFVGAWMTFKTIGIWGRWGKSRTVYNRFLIGNALNLMAAFIISRIFY